MINEIENKYISIDEYHMILKGIISINPHFIKNIKDCDDEFLSEAWEIAIQNDPDLFEELLAKFINDNIAEFIIKEYPEYIPKLPDKYKSEDVWLKYILEIGCFRDVPKDLVDDEHFLIKCVEADPPLIGFIDHPSEIIQMAAFKKNPSAMVFNISMRDISDKIIIKILSTGNVDLIRRVIIYHDWLWDKIMKLGYDEYFKYIAPNRYMEPNQAIKMVKEYPESLNCICDAVMLDVYKDNLYETFIKSAPRNIFNLHYKEIKKKCYSRRIKRMLFKRKYFGRS